MMMTDNDTRYTNADCVVLPSVSQNNDDKRVQQLLKKLDEGSETILNLRSLLTLKTIELNELVHQLELIDQVLIHVENGTEQIEIALKDVLSSNDQQDKLVNAEATLDTAIKSACSLYSDSVNNKQVSPIHTASILKKIAGILDELNIASTMDLYIHDDIQVLQKAYMDLDLAKAIATSIRTDFKHRSTLLKKKPLSSMDKIKQLGNTIRKQVEIYQSYARNAPLVLYGHQDIISILDREDRMMASRMVHDEPTEKPTRIFCSSTNTPKKRQSSSSSSPLKIKSRSTTNTTKSTLQMISRPTLTFMAKCKEKRVLNNRPGSTLRLRNMLARRNPTSKMMNEHIMVC